MARPRTVDRERLLIEAERLLTEQGAAQLSFGSLAQASGVPKASIQSAFGTREQLLDALIERWMCWEAQRYDALVGIDPSPERRLRAHLATTAEETQEASSRITSALAAMVGSGHQSKTIADWYQSRLGSLEASSTAERKRRIAYLAAEGAYYIRHMAKYEISDRLWREIFDDLEKFAFEDQP